MNPVVVESVHEAVMTLFPIEGLVPLYVLPECVTDTELPFIDNDTEEIKRFDCV